MRGFRRITVSLVVHQMQGNADVFAARDGICRKVDEILVEAEVSIINEEIGLVFKEVLECAGVYKCTDEGRAAFQKFIDAVNA